MWSQAIASLHTEHSSAFYSTERSRDGTLPRCEKESPNADENFSRTGEHPAYDCRQYGLSDRPYGRRLPPAAVPARTNPKFNRIHSAYTRKAGQNRMGRGLEISCG